MRIITKTLCHTNEGDLDKSIQEFLKGCDGMSLVDIKFSTANDDSYIYFSCIIIMRA